VAAVARSAWAPIPIEPDGLFTRLDRLGVPSFADKRTTVDRVCDSVILIETDRLLARLDCLSVPAHFDKGIATNGMHNGIIPNAADDLLAGLNRLGVPAFGESASIWPILRPLDRIDALSPDPASETSRHDTSLR
jgi:hypothetical protein